MQMLRALETPALRLETSTIKGVTEMSDHHKDHLALTKYIRGKRKVKLPKGHMSHAGHGATKSIRRQEYKGKSIRVETSYKFYIDDKPVNLHASVMNDGKVHCHTLPQYAFTSALQMLRRVVDVMDIPMPPNELGKNRKKSGKPDKPHHHGG